MQHWSSGIPYTSSISYTGWHIKKCTFCCLQRVYHTVTHVLKISVTYVQYVKLCCSPSSETVRLIKSVRQTCSSVTSRMTSQRIFNMNSIAKILILYRLQILSLASSLYKIETIVEQQFMLIMLSDCMMVHFFSVPLCNALWRRKAMSFVAVCSNVGVV